MTSSTILPTAAGKTSASTGKYLTFTLGSESYAIAVTKVREIIRPVTITLVPQMPDFVKGVINLRGKIIPIVDLRMKFQLTGSRDTERTCFIVVQIALRLGANPLMGLIVDAVEEVLTIQGADIEPTPDFGPSVESACIIGMAKLKGSVKTLLDIDQLLQTAPGASLLNGLEISTPSTPHTP